MAGNKWLCVLFSPLRCYRCGEDGCLGCKFIGVVKDARDVLKFIGGFKSLRDLVVKLCDFLGYGGGSVVSDLFYVRRGGYASYVLFYVPEESSDMVESELRRNMVALNGVVAGYRVVFRGDGVVWYAVKPVDPGVLWDFLWFLSGLVCRVWCVRGAGFSVVGGALHRVRYVYTWLKDPFRRDIPEVDTRDVKKYVEELLRRKKTIII
ncbi:MAG: hypothetical protein GXO43_05980 [Crenarchaeota archaeon]|nr:hypothetical protein [Thermoproteota archaeon]